MEVVNLNVLMKEISEALRLDNENNEKEAYRKYVGCIFAIASNLMEDIKIQGGHVVVSHSITKQVKLIQQCTDRVADLIKTLGTATTNLNMPATSQSESPTTPSTKQNMKEPVNGNEEKTFQPPTVHVSQLQNYSGKITAEAPDAEKNGHGRFRTPIPALPPENNPHAIIARKSRPLTPMEIATKQNQSLMVALKARMLRLNKSDFNAFNYSLAIQRKMMENIAIAKAQEEELARKMQARNQRLELEATKRFASPAGMSESEKEQKNMYKRILEYENEAHWLKQWRVKIAENPEDPVLICRLVQEVLRCSDHPITELLKQYQFKIYQRLFPLVEKRAKKLAQIKVPLAEDLWPRFEDVKDIVGVMTPNDRKLEEDDAEQGDITVSHQAKRSFATPAVKDETTAFDNIEDPGATNVTVSNKIIDSNRGDADSSSSLRNSKISSETQNSWIGTTEQEDRPPQKHSLNPRERKISWERRQAKLLMKQVNERYVLQDYMNIEEDDNLDYLFEEDDDETTESMYSSISYIRTSPELDILPKEESEPDVNLQPSRSVSHEFQSSNISDKEDNCSMFQSLPYSSFKERNAESEEVKKIARLSLEACESHLKAICEDIHQYLDKLLVLMTIAYEHLDTPVGKDQCAVSLEEPFFKPIWKTLLLLFRVVNQRQEQVLACVMTSHQSASPGDLNVNKKLWLMSDLEESSLKESVDMTKKPYEKVVIELKRVGDHYTMLSKLECIVKVCRLICECVDDFYSSSQQGEKKAPSVGADDLVPILCYVIVRSKMPQLASECQAMAEFIQEGYLMGEEGYCLTTLRTALAYVTSLYPAS